MSRGGDEGAVDTQSPDEGEENVAVSGDAEGSHGSPRPGRGMFPAAAATHSSCNTPVSLDPLHSGNVWMECHDMDTHHHKSRPKDK